MASQSKYTILYGRLSQEDDRAVDSNSIINQKEICQGYFYPFVQWTKPHNKLLRKR